MTCKAVFLAVSALCLLRGSTSYLIEGGFAVRDAPARPIDPFPGYAVRPTISQFEASTRCPHLQLVALRAGRDSPSFKLDVASELSHKPKSSDEAQLNATELEKLHAELEKEHAFKMALLEKVCADESMQQRLDELIEEGKARFVENIKAFLSKMNITEEDATEEDATEGKSLDYMRATKVVIEKDGLGLASNEQLADLLVHCWRWRYNEDEFGDQVVVTKAEQAQDKLLEELMFRDQGNGTLTVKQILDLGYAANGEKLRAALKAEILEAKELGRSKQKRKEKEEPRTISGVYPYNLIAGDQQVMLEDYIAGGLGKEVHEDHVVSPKELTEVGQSTFVDKNGTMYIGLASPMHPATQELAKEALVSDWQQEVSWSQVQDAVAQTEEAIKMIGKEWDSKREARGLTRWGGAKDAEEDKKDPEVSKEVQRMMRNVGKDGMRIESDHPLMPWWLARKLKCLVTPAREALRIGALLAVIVSFGGAVEYTNLLLKGPRRTTPRPVRTTTGLPY